MSGTKRFVEQRVIKRREQEAKDMELRRKLTEHNILAGHGSSATRVENKRRARSEAAERRELFMDYSHVTQQQDKARRAQIAQFEEYLADELSRRKAAQLREEMEKRRICDGSEELRALKERLHVAKVNKERAMQLMDQGNREEEERMHEKRIAEMMEQERLEHLELEHKLQVEKMKQRERVKQIQHQQISMKEAQREDALQEYLKDKQQVNDLVDKIAREDAHEAAVKHQKQEETKQALQKFRIEQRHRQEQMEQAERDEAAKIEQYAADKRAREEQLERERVAAEKEKARILNQMLGDMEAKTRAAEELEQLRNDLHMEELEAEKRRREEVQMRKRLEDREEMKNAYLFQMQMKEEKLANQRAEEAKIREQLMKKFAEDDRIEQMNEHKRRMKVEAHKREAERLLQLRREMYEQQREAEREVDARLREDESKRQVIIEEERRRLIQEHAAELAKFLPKGTLETPEDFLLMGMQAPQRSPA